ncbi:Ataxin-7-like 3, partial [Manacus vitellinus]
EDACLGLCFEVHRAVKCGYFFLDDTDPDSMKDFEIVDQPGVDIFGQILGCWGRQGMDPGECMRVHNEPWGAGEVGGYRTDPGVPWITWDRSWPCPPLPSLHRIASSNNLNKSESDQEDNDDINDNDWSYGSEKKGWMWGGFHPWGRGCPGLANLPEKVKSVPSLSLPIAKKRKSDKVRGQGVLWGINYETLGPEELRTLLTTQCGVISEHTKKMCTRSLRCPQHTDEQRRAVRVYLLGPSASLPEAEAGVENDSFEVAESQALMSRLQWDGSSDISPSDSASSKASTNNSESRKTKKKKPHLGLVSGAPGLGSSKKKKPKPPAP